MQDLNARTAAEQARLVQAAHAALPVPMRRPDGETRLVAPANVQDRLDAGWTR